MSCYTTALFIFRRDLRLYDNNGLNAALRLSERVVPCFIFDPRQIQPHPYRSNPGLRFMMLAVADLQRQLEAAGGELALFYNEPNTVIKMLFDELHIDAVFINRDYSPFSRRRDAAIAELCKQLSISLHVLPDALLTEPEQMLKSDGSPYKAFTAFYNRARQIPPSAPQALARRNFQTIASGFDLEQLPLSVRLETQGAFRSGRQEALAALERLGACRNYALERDYPERQATSNLSAHLKFGTCSIREAYYAIAEQLGDAHPMLRQLYWRDFFTHVAYHFPHVFGHAFAEKFERLRWDNNPEHFNAWCEGRTGFPIVDAGMRELNASGFMHNRVRMITASFLVKDLHIDWRWGERYFAQHLVDYDPCLNNGNWQWTASTGCDAQPYFRIFNPWNQQQKFDPDCRYIRRWIPELKDVAPEIILQWDKKHVSCEYPAPIVDHARESRIAKERYRLITA